MNFSTGHATVDIVGQLHLTGNIVHHSWYQHIRYSNKRGVFTDPWAVLILAVITDDFIVKNDSGIAIGIHLSWQTGVLALTPDACSVMSDLLGITTKIFKNSLQVLINRGFVVMLPPLSRVEVAKLLKQKTPQTLSSRQKAFRSCEWCKSLTNILHQHHFPDSRLEGGTETVGICPNCHSEYHALESAPQLQLTSKAFELMEVEQ
jgi:hypothetical protein